MTEQDIAKLKNEIVPLARKNIDEGLRNGFLTPTAAEEQHRLLRQVEMEIEREERDGYLQ